MKAIPAALAIAAFLGTPVFAQSDFAAMAEAELPAESLELIQSRIAAYTTFQQLSPDGIVRWSPRAIELVHFVKVASPSKADTWLYALQYVVSVLDQGHSLAVDGTLCQVSMISEKRVYFEPTIVCDPVNVSRATSTL